MANMEEDDALTRGRCMKHDAAWRNNTQWVMNKLRTAVIPTKYLGRFNHILCTCPEHFRVGINDNPWETITIEQYHQAVTAVDNHVNSNTGNPNAEIMRKLLEMMRRDGLVAPANSAVQPFPQSSALRMVYIIQQCINQSYNIFFAPNQAMRLARENQKQKFTITFELESIQPRFVAQIIGWRGAHIQPFQRQKKCGITIDKKMIGMEEKVFATIEKRCESLDMVEELKDDVQRWAVERQDSADQETHTASDSSEDIADPDSDSDDNQQGVNPATGIHNLSIQTTAAATGTSAPANENTSVKELANQQSASSTIVSNDEEAQSSGPSAKRFKKS